MRDGFRHVAFCALLTLGLAPGLSAAGLTLDGQTSVDKLMGEQLQVSITGTPGKPVVLLADLDPGPTPLFGQSVDIGFTPGVIVINLPAIPGSGELSFNPTVPFSDDLDGVTIYMVAIVLDDGVPFGLDFSDGANFTIRERNVELAGNTLGGYPHFEYVRAFNFGSTVEVAMDPFVYPDVVGKSADIYVTASQDKTQWINNPTLVDVSGDGANTVAFTGVDIQSNTFVVDAGTLSAFAGDGLGVPYDVVVDMNQDGVFNDGDYIDGFSDEQAGLYVVHDTTQPGPYAVTEILYSGGIFLGQNTFYPSNIAGLAGPLPLVVVSHGNGHNYQWYDHIGNHLASYGYVVMSHQNNTVPGVETASTTTLTNTDYFLENLDTIAGGIFEGKIDTSRIAWFGHSRGGEGVARAYDRIFDGTWTPTSYTLDDIQLVSSIAPTDFLGTNSANPHGANYHMWIGSADNDVWLCANNDVAQSHHLHDRATDMRHMVTYYGVGHGDFHNGGGSSVAAGPCQVGRPTTHALMRGYILPLVKYHIDGNVPAKDFLWRQWERFHPIGAPFLNPCVHVNMQFREAPDAGKFVIDDFQTNNQALVSSSGGAITSTVILREGRLDDANTNFTTNTGDLFNGMIMARSSDTSRGMVFEFNGADETITWDIVPEGQDFTGHVYLSFRIAQETRHALTIAVQEDLTFDVTLRDGAGGSSTINVSAYGGGVEEPYQRTGCGSGVGWNNEFEVIRMRLTDFLNNNSGLDLSNVVALDMQFGPSHGSSQGRLGLDELELTQD